MLLLSQCYCVVDSTIVPPSINDRFVSINVCVAVRSFVLIVSDIPLFALTRPILQDISVRSLLLVCSWPHNDRDAIPGCLLAYSDSANHHSLDFEDCVLVWLPRTNCMALHATLPRSALISSPDSLIHGPSFHGSSCNSASVCVCLSTVEWVDNFTRLRLVNSSTRVCSTINW